MLVAVVALVGRSGDPAAQAPPVIIASGDIACGSTSVSGRCVQGPTSDIVVAQNPDAVLALGDNQYECGELPDFQQYYEPTWGRFKAKTHPVAGNHEYDYTQSTCTQHTPGAAGYYTYFGAAASPLDQPCTSSCEGWYSFDLGAWHLIALNSNCRIVGCDAASPQAKWLAADLAAHPNQCLLAYYHHPRFTSGQEGDTTGMDALFKLLYDAHVDVVLNGHDHDYERFAPLAPDGSVDPANGIREFVVGTGGRNNIPILHVHAGSEVRNSNQLFGDLRLTLSPTGYDWRFLPVAGQDFSDAGSEPCHFAAGADTTPPSAPTRVTASALRGTAVDVSWTGAKDNVGVVAYIVKRDGVPVATVGAVGSWTDTNVAPGESHTYAVTAVDAAGNRSRGSAPETATVPAAASSGIVFRDDFESGDLSRWTSGGNLVADSSQAHGGRWSVRAASTGAPTTAYEQLGTPLTTLYQRVVFKLNSPPPDAVDLLQLLTPDGIPRLTFSRNADGTLGYVNFHTATAATSPVDVSVGVWHELQVRVDVAGRTSTVQTWLDGVPVASLSRTEALGTSPIGRVQLGDSVGGRTYDVSFDDVATATTPLAPLIFHDSFESGDLAGWTSSTGLTVEPTLAAQGADAAELTAAGAPAYAVRSLGSSRTDLWYRLRFLVRAQGANSTYLLRLRTAGGSSLLGVYLTSGGTLSYRNDVAGTTAPMTVAPARDTWHTVLVHAVTGAAGRVDLWLDGSLVSSRTENLGSTPIGALQIGDNARGKTFDLFEDDVTADTAPLSP